MRILAALLCGIASQYASGVMNQVIHNRQAMHQLPAVLPDVRGYVAVIDCGRIGEVLQVNGEPMLAVDCTNDSRTIAWMQNNNILIEMDFDTAKRLGTIGRGYPVCIGSVNRVDKHRVERAS